ncbi:hypothetical protein BU17DRAFT_71654 [Hysterangium stoloniferum]|nr:hypothetical protein BU17DRAFT_71654 [Hysterangium stoloniferum]
MRQVRPSGVARNAGTRARCRMAREDVAEGSAAMTGWWCGREVTPGLSLEQCISENSNNRISTSSICEFARDGITPSYAIRMSPRFAFGVLPLLIYETIVCFLVLWKAIQNSGDGRGLHFYQEWYMTVSSPFCVLTSPSYCPPGACSSYPFYPIDRIPAHPREVKITTVTLALDEFCRFHRAIGEQIGQSICCTDSQ